MRIYHDGRFGADKMNILRDGAVIATVPYQPNGQQRAVVERIVTTWNEFDLLKAKYDALLLDRRN